MAYFTSSLSRHTLIEPCRAAFCMLNPEHTLKMRMSNQGLPGVVDLCKLSSGLRLVSGQVSTPAKNSTPAYAASSQPWRSNIPICLVLNRAVLISKDSDDIFCPIVDLDLIRLAMRAFLRPGTYRRATGITTICLQIKTSALRPTELIPRSGPRPKRRHAYPEPLVSEEPTVNWV